MSLFRAERTNPRTILNPSSIPPGSPHVAGIAKEPKIRQGMILSSNDMVNVCTRRPANLAAPMITPDNLYPDTPPILRELAITRGWFGLKTQKAPPV